MIEAAIWYAITREGSPMESDFQVRVVGWSYETYLPLACDG